MDCKIERAGVIPASATTGFQERNMVSPQDKDTQNLPDYVRTGDYLLSLDVKGIPALYDLFPFGGLSMLVGASDTGKSMALNELGMCVSAGRDFLGRKFNGTYKKVIAVITEDDDIAVSYRLNRQNRTLHIPPEDLRNIRFIFDTENLLDKLESELKRDPADLIVIDALGDVFNGKDLNANNQVRSFLQPYSTLAGKYKCAVIFLHHTSKRSEDLIPSKNNSIGSQGIEAKSRFVAELRRSKFGADIRHLCIVKGNYLSDAEKSASIDLKMDENLVFTDTGGRTDFEDLIATTNGNRKAPEYVDDADHIACIQAIFKTKKDMYSSRQLVALIAQHFDISDKTARKYRDFYLAREWLKDISRSKSRNEFIINELTGKLRV